MWYALQAGIIVGAVSLYAPNPDVSVGQFACFGLLIAYTLTYVLTALIDLLRTALSSRRGRKQDASHGAGITRGGSSLPLKPRLHRLGK